MRHYILTEGSKRDLEGIYDYIAEDNYSAAKRFVEKCFKAFDLLSEKPYIGHKREDLTNWIVRFWRVDSYFIIYEPDIRPISISRIVNARRDLTNILS